MSLSSNITISCNFKPTQRETPTTKLANSGNSHNESAVQKSPLKGTTTASCNFIRTNVPCPTHNRETYSVNPACDQSSAQLAIDEYSAIDDDDNWDSLTGPNWDSFKESPPSTPSLRSTGMEPVSESTLVEWSPSYSTNFWNSEDPSDYTPPSPIPRVNSQQPGEVDDEGRTEKGNTIDTATEAVKKMPSSAEHPDDSVARTETASILVNDMMKMMEEIRKRSSVDKCLAKNLCNGLKKMIDKIRKENSMDPYAAGRSSSIQVKAEVDSDSSNANQPPSTKNFKRSIESKSKQLASKLNTKWELRKLHEDISTWEGTKYSISNLTPTRSCRNRVNYRYDPLREYSEFKYRFHNMVKVKPKKLIGHSSTPNRIKPVDDASSSRNDILPKEEPNNEKIQNLSKKRGNMELKIVIENTDKSYPQVSLNINTPKTEDGFYRCNVCKKTFSHRIELRLHRETFGKKCAVE